jgi:hypothetical protein
METSPLFREGGANRPPRRRNTPCQAFSVAGLRGGLADDRGNLALEFMSASLIGFALAGFSGKTSPVFCPATEDGTLVPSSGRWAYLGYGFAWTECWTLSSTECPSAVVASSLSDILETGDVPQRYFLSAKACVGILRRAEKRGKKLPELLELALREVGQATSNE